MAITINSTRENDTDQTVYFSIDYDGAKTWHGDIPKDAEDPHPPDDKSDGGHNVQGPHTPPY